MRQSTSELIAAYAADARRPPRAVIEEAKLHIADTLACIYAASGSETVQILARAHHWAGTPDDVPVPGWGFAKTLDGAAAMIGTAAHDLDYDNTSALVPGHPSAPILAAMLVTVVDLAQHPGRRVAGIEFVSAYVKGMEIAAKVGEAFGVEHKGQGWHTISTIAMLGAATACAALRALDADGCERSLAIACSHVSGLLGNSGTMVKPLHSGNGARGGFTAAALAADGFTAGENIIAGHYGLANAITGGRFRDIELQSIDREGALLPPLAGEQFEFISPGLKVKLFPCCQVAHRCIDAAIKIYRRRDLDIGAIDRIDCFVPTEMKMRDLQCPAPRTPTEARFSMNFAVAVALIHGELKIRHFSAELLNAHDVRALMSRVEMRLPEGGSADEVDVEIRLKDGRRITQVGRDGPPTWEDVETKFHDCLARALQPVQPAPLLSFMRELEDEPDVMGLVTGCPGERTEAAGRF